MRKAHQGRKPFFVPKGREIVASDFSHSRADGFAGQGGRDARAPSKKLLAFLLLLSFAVPVHAGDLNGSARVYGGSIDNDGNESDQVDQKYSLNLRQALTSYLTLQLGFRRTDFRSEPDGLDAFERETDEPRLELLYNRPNVDARLSYQDRSTRSTNDSLDLRSLLAQVRWRPRVGPELSLRLRDESNVADAEIFGRDTDSQTIHFEALYERRLSSLRYSYQQTRLDNAATRFSFDEDRHQLHGTTSRRLLDGRLSLSADGWISHREQSEEAGFGDPAEPVPARDGLFAVDTTPEIGELEAAPEIIDGDRETATAIEIGGAQTFRNLGVDLGVTRPGSRLEVFVDAPSDPGLLWEVYHSPDNETWTRVPRLQSEFDDVLLRYRLRFDTITDRYFKAVNVSANTFTDVHVTEVRVLVDVDTLRRRDASATTYRADVSALYRPNDRVRASVSLGLGNDETLAGGLLSRDLEELDLTAVVQADLRRDLQMRVTYRFTDFEEQGAPVLRREEEQAAVSLDYSPVETVDAVFTVARRDERDGNLLVRSSDTWRLRTRLELLPELEATTEVTFSDVDDPFFGFSQSVWRWRETLVGRPRPNWTIWATLSEAYYDSTGTLALEKRRVAELRTTWSATPYLTLSGDWSLSDEEDPMRPERGSSLGQRYSVFYAPGPKLSASLSYQDTDAQDVRATTTLGAGLNYRLNPRFTPYANFSRSTFVSTLPFGGADGEEVENTSLRLGFNLFF